MMQKLIIMLSTLAAIAASAPTTAAAPCRDAKGKFIKCTKAGRATPAHCRGSNGKYVKCATPGAKAA